MKITKKGERHLASTPTGTPSRVMQSDVPHYGLNEAMRVATALADNFGKNGASAIQLAQALNLSPQGGRYKWLTGTALAYGLTTAAGQAKKIELSPLGRRITRPTTEGDDTAAKREAFMRPRVIGEFLQRYHGHPFPNVTIAKNVLDEMGVPRDRIESCFKLILDGATSLGLLQTIREKQYVERDAAATVPMVADVEAPEADADLSEDASNESGNGTTSARTAPKAPAGAAPAKPGTDPRKDLIYISHGTNKALLATIQKSLKIGGLQAVISVDRSSVSSSMSEKVLREMRLCGGAIIHIDVEQRVTLPDGEERVILNENVLIEIGAAMAMYGDRYILLVKDGIVLPSNIKGRFEVRYKGEALDGDEAFRLLESLHDLKTRPLPGEVT